MQIKNQKIKNVFFVLLSTVYYIFFTTILYFILLSHAYCYESYDFLCIPVSAKQASIGKSNLGIINDPLAMFVNPAALQTEEQLGIGYMNYLAGTHFGCIAKTSSFANGVYGIGVNYWNMGTIYRYDESESKGRYTPQIITPTLAYAHNIRHFSENNPAILGANCKLIYQSIDEWNSTVFASDIGAFIPIRKELILGGTINNLGFQITKFDSIEEKLPIFARIGGVWTASIGKHAEQDKENIPTEEEQNSATVKQPHVYYPQYQVSIEISLPEKELLAGVELQAYPLFTLRGGYYSTGKEIETGRALEFLSGLTLGAGFKLTNFLLDYAVIPFAELGFAHQFSLTYLPVKNISKEKDVYKE